MTERELFIAALNHGDPGARSAFIAQACGGDVELRRRVEVLLDEHEGLGSFLERPAAELRTTGPDAPPREQAGAPAGSSERPGSLIGPYKLLQQVGEGGMGAVWMAEQTQPVQRKVALKIIKYGMDTAQVVARFEAERQALALMDHPHIAKVFDGGATDAGRPYFVMELVKGQPINRYCDEHRLTTRQRLELFIPVCQAIQHAHQKGIIHRDVKPSNVLVAPYDGSPVVKVIDFGVAKATGQRLTERTLFTEFGAVVGTLEYMSPEQAELNNQDIDTRSDVYSLGVLLYELLTGTTPLSRERLKQAAFTEMLRMIREEEPPRPSTRLSESKDSLPSISAQRQTEPAKLTKLVRGELDWIVMKALEKGRSRRYETANGFAQDLQRYLADEPVLACPPSMRYRLRKFARRNKRALTTMTLAGLMLLVTLGAVSGSIGWVVRDRAAQQQVKEGEAEAALRQAAQSLEEGKSPEAGTWIRRAEVLLTGFEPRSELRARLEELSADLAMVSKVGEIRVRQSDVRADRFAVAEADLEYSEAFREYGIDVEALGPGDAARRIGRPSIRLELIHALDDWADIRCQHKTGDGSWKHLIAVARAADSDGLRDQLRAALAREPRDREALKRIAASGRLPALSAATLRLLGNSLRNAGALEDAVAVLRQAQQHYPDDFWINESLGNRLMELRPPRWREALPFYTAAVALRPESPGARINLVKVLTDHLGDYDGSITLCKEVLRLKPDYWAAHHNMGVSLEKKGLIDEAIAAYRRAIQLKPEAPLPHLGLGNALLAHNDLAGAIESFRESIKRDSSFVRAHENLGSALYAQNDLAGAVASFQKAIAIDPKSASGHHNLGNVLFARRDLPGAIAAQEKAIALDSMYADAYTALGNCLHTKKDIPGAVAAYQKAISLLRPLVEEAPKNRNHRRKLATARNELGSLFRMNGRPQDAKAEFLEALAIQKVLVADFPNVPDFQHALAGTLVNLGAMLMDVEGKHQAARELYEQAEPHHLAALKARPDHPVYRRWYVVNRKNLAIAAIGLGDHATCASAIEQWVRFSSHPVEDLFLAANRLADCVRAAGADAKLSSECRTGLAQTYGDRAMALLRQAVQKGFNNYEAMTTNRYLDPIRSRRDYQDLQAELEKKSK